MVETVRTGFSESFAATRRVIVERTGIKDQDVLLQHLRESQTFVPGHFVAIDHQHKSLVICVRGTFSVQDALVDLNCAPEPLTFQQHSGCAHSGMLRSAREVLRRVERIVQRTVELFPHYTLETCGHSLGGGTATLLAILLLQRYPRQSVHAYVFGAAAVLSLELAHAVEPFVTSIIFQVS